MGGLFLGGPFFWVDHLIIFWEDHFLGGPFLGGPFFGRTIFWEDYFLGGPFVNFLVAAESGVMLIVSKVDLLKKIHSNLQFGSQTCP